MRNHRSILLLVLLALAGTAAADTVIEQAREQLKNKQAAAAYSLLAPHAEERAGEPEFDYLLGIAALDAGEPGEAVFALERVLAADPDNTLARAEIARAYYALSEFETARQEFENVQDAGEVPAEARATLDRYLSLIERAQIGPSRVSGYLSVAFGYDSNVNSGTDESQVAIPILGNLPFQLVDGALDQEDGFVTVAGGVNASHPLTKQWALVGGARGYYRNTQEPFSTADVYLYGGVRGTFGKHELTFAGQGENFAVDAESLRHVYGGFGQWNYALDQRSRVSVALQASQIDYPDLPNRDATRWVGSTSYLRVLPGKSEPLVYAGAYGGFEDENRNAFQQFGHDLYGGRAGGSLAVFARTRMYASVSFEQRDYDGDDPIFLRTRDDTQFTVTGGFDIKLANQWFLRPNVNYISNDSNIPINDYNRIIAGFDVSLRF